VTMIHGSVLGTQTPPLEIPLFFLFILLRRVASPLRHEQRSSVSLPSCADVFLCEPGHLEKAI